MPLCRDAEHTTQVKCLVRKMIIDVLTPDLQIYVRLPTLFIVKALLFASARFIASVVLVNGRVLGC